MKKLIVFLLLIVGCGKDEKQNPVSSAIPNDMVLIPAGSFRMGDVTGNGLSSTDELPVHQVTVSHRFLMSRTEVTQGQWKAVMGSNPSSFSGDSLPVEQVTWYDAVDYCNHRSAKEHLAPCYSSRDTGIKCNFSANGYRLPTEAEWEYACRGGTETDFYTGNMTGSSGGDSALNLACWYNANSGGTTHKVGSKNPNAFGLFDMHGNVWEWCWDWYADAYPSSNSVTDPRGPATGAYRVLRGGSWYYSAYYCRSADRDGYDPVRWSGHYGLRVVRNY